MSELEYWLMAEVGAWLGRKGRYELLVVLALGVVGLIYGLAKAQGSRRKQ